MELWIRNQSKEKLVKVNELSLYDSNILKNSFVLNDEPGYSDISIIANDNYHLGSYKSKERAIEILDHIQFLIEQTGELTERIVEDIRELLKDEMWSINSTSNTATYEMPKE